MSLAQLFGQVSEQTKPATNAAAPTATTTALFPSINPPDVVQPAAAAAVLPLAEQTQAAAPTPEPAVVPEAPKAKRGRPAAAKAYDAAQRAQDGAINCSTDDLCSELRKRGYTVTLTLSGGAS